MLRSFYLRTGLSVFKNDWYFHSIILNEIQCPVGKWNLKTFLSINAHQNNVRGFISTNSFLKHDNVIQFLAFPHCEFRLNLLGSFIYRPVCLLSRIADIFITLFWSKFNGYLATENNRWYFCNICLIEIQLDDIN
jgi:hypothetical protein